jgi:hypothetical protein
VSGVSGMSGEASNGKGFTLPDMRKIVSGGVGQKPAQCDFKSRWVPDWMRFQI